MPTGCSARWSQATPYGMGTLWPWPPCRHAARWVILASRHQGRWCSVKVVSSLGAFGGLRPGLAQQLAVTLKKILCWLDRSAAVGTVTYPLSPTPAPSPAALLALPPALEVPRPQEPTGLWTGTGHCHLTGMWGAVPANLSGTWQAPSSSAGHQHSPGTSQGCGHPGRMWAPSLGLWAPMGHLIAMDAFSVPPRG